MFRRIVVGVAVVFSYILAYWLSIFLWSLAGFATLGEIATLIDAILRSAAIPFLLGGLLAGVFKKRLEVWALAVAPFVSSAALLLGTGTRWHEISNGVLGFWVIGGLSALCAVAGGITQRRAALQTGLTGGPH